MSDPNSPSPLHTLFVWDFDWTVINCNSDEYIPSQFLGHSETQNGFHDLLSSQDPDFDWHKCVEALVGRAMDERGASSQDVLRAAGRMPYLTEVRGAIKDVASSEKAGQMILSDGNTLFIMSFLEANDMDTCFDEGIMTNIGSFAGEDGHLRVVHQSAKYGGHTCKRCARSPNLCKTQALKDKLNQLTAEAAGGRRPKRILYVGDGANDACPALNVLGENDVLLARVGVRREEANDRSGAETDEEAKDRLTSGKGEVGGGKKFALSSTMQRAEEKGEIAKCKVLEWQTGSDLRALVGKYLEEITAG